MDTLKFKAIKHKEIISDVIRHWPPGFEGLSNKFEATLLDIEQTRKMQEARRKKLETNTN